MMKKTTVILLFSGVFVGALASAATIAALRIPAVRAWALGATDTPVATSDEKEARQIDATAFELPTAARLTIPSGDAAAEEFERTHDAARSAASPDMLRDDVESTTKRDPVSPGDSTETRGAAPGSKNHNEESESRRVNYVELTENLQEMTLALESFNTKLRRSLTGAREAGADEAPATDSEEETSEESVTSTRPNSNNENEATR